MLIFYFLTLCLANPTTFLYEAGIIFLSHQILLDNGINSIDYTIDGSKLSLELNKETDFNKLFKSFCSVCEEIGFEKFKASNIESWQSIFDKENQVSIDKYLNDYDTNLNIVPDPEKSDTYVLRRAPKSSALVWKPNVPQKELKSDFFSLFSNANEGRIRQYASLLSFSGSIVNKYGSSSQKLTAMRLGEKVNSRRSIRSRKEGLYYDGLKQENLQSTRSQLTSIDSNSYLIKSGGKFVLVTSNINLYNLPIDSEFVTDTTKRNPKGFITTTEYNKLTNMKSTKIKQMRQYSSKISVGTSKDAVMNEAYKFFFSGASTSSSAKNHAEMMKVSISINNGEVLLKNLPDKLDNLIDKSNSRVETLVCSI